MKKNIIAVSVHVIVFAALVVTMGVLSTLAAAASNPVSNKFDGVLEENVTLHILENDTAKEQGFLQYVLDAFNEKYRDKGIVAVDANRDQFADLENDGPYGFGPDVLYQANDAIMKYVPGRHIQPLPIDHLECYSQVSEQAWKAYREDIEGTEYVFGVPVNIQGPVLYYRKDLLPADWKTNWDKDNNDIPDMVENWRDLYKYSKKVKEESGGARFGYMKSLDDTYFSSGFLFSFGGYVFGDDGHNVDDIGFSHGDSYKGARILRQLASVMNQECIDDTITKNAYSKLGDGSYFATMTTPDVYSLFIKELATNYAAQGLDQDAAKAKAVENLVETNVPTIPESGSLLDDASPLMTTTMMGGINGYAISSYTKYPNDSLAFIDFATSFASIKKRNELLGIAPARQDVAAAVGGLVDIVSGNLVSGHISVMPSVKEIAQIWTPTKTFFSDLAKDPFRPLLNEPTKYETDEALIAALKAVDQNIYEAIHTLR